MAFARQVATLPGVHIEGLFTHLATADRADVHTPASSCVGFGEVLDAWEGAGLPRPRYVHAQTARAGLRLPEARFDLVCAGDRPLRPAPERRRSLAGRI